ASTPPHTLSLHDALPISLRTGHRQRFDLAALDGRDIGRHRVEGDVDVLADQIGNDGWGAAVLDGAEFDTGRALQKNAGDVPERRSEEHTSELQSRENLVW